MDRRTLLIVGCMAPVLAVAGLVGVAGVAYFATKKQQELAAPPETAYTPATREEIDQLARDLEARFATDAELHDLFDWGALLRRGLPEGLAAQTVDPAFVTGVENGSRSPDGFVGRVREVLNSGGTFRYRGVVRRDGEPVARFRLVHGTGGLNFDDFVVGRDERGQLRIIDVYTALGGEYMSRSIARFYVMFQSSEPGFVDRMRGADNAFAREVEDLREVNDLLEQGRPEEALARCDSLSPELRSSSAVLLLRIEAARQLGDARYVQVLDEAAQVATTDRASIRLMSFDAHYLRKEWATCLEDLAIVEATYPDPYLVAMESRVRTLSGDPANGLAVAERAIGAEPTLLDAHDAALFAALALRDRRRALRALDVLVTEHGVDVDALSRIEGYERVAELGYGGE